MSRFSRRHYRLVSPASDTADAIQDRRIRSQAAASGVLDRAARFPELTAENAQAALDYQAERIRVHEDALRQASA